MTWFTESDYMAEKSRRDLSEESFLDELHEFLSQPDVDLFFAQHPNALTSSGWTPPNSWHPWWDWSKLPVHERSQKGWEVLWNYYSQEQAVDTSQIPEELLSFIDNARRLQLLRACGYQAIPHQSTPAVSRASPEQKIHGMSPKKAHEVIQTVEHLRDVLQNLSASGIDVKHIVDVGAGQAYLSRALRDDLGLHVLALDWSNIQSEGAKRREGRKQKVSRDKTSKLAGRNGSLTYKTLQINAQSLLEAIDDWIPSGETGQKAPVLFVALHACGSLTLNVFRAFLCALRGHSNSRCWSPAGALVVGCCYNLLQPEDQRSLTGRTVKFHENHLQMAAQAPLQWKRTPDAWASTILSFKKTAWRALLTGIIQERCATQDHEMVGKRLGRVNDTVYESWVSFLGTSAEKFGLDLTGAKKDQEAEGRVEIFQFLRCILGPVVESFILLDRKTWLGNELKGTGHSVHLLNLFDQSTGSARNVAIVVTPTFRVQET